MTTTASRTIARGQDFSYIATLEGTGSIAGATLAVNIRRRGTRQVLLALTPAIVDALARTVNIALTPAETAQLQADPADPTVETEHVADVYMTLAGEVSNYGPLILKVRQPA